MDFSQNANNVFKGDGILGKSPFFKRICFMLFVITFFSVVVAASSIDLHEVIGEIVAITADTVRIAHDGMIDDYRLTPVSKITCNGLTGTWLGLRPITSQAFFEARALVNQEGKIISIDGSYRGEECVILRWFYRAGHLWLQLEALEKNHTQWKVVKIGARLPEEGWLSTGQDVFVVYDQAGEIRGIYVPD